MVKGDPTMPVIGIPVKKLQRFLDAELSSESLIEKLIQIGCDIDGITSLYRLKCTKCETIEEYYTKDNPPKQCGACQSELLEDGGSVELEAVEVIRMELLPVRPDTFDPAGLARAIRGLVQTDVGLAEYKTKKSNFTVNVDESVNSDSCSRPFIACAIIRGIKLDESFIRNIMTLQENLHWALGRNRKFASIGVYDLDTVKGDFHYTATDKAKTAFCPLGYPDTLMTPEEILTKHHKGKEFAFLLENSKKYPVLKDSENRVLSMPPIINSDETKVTLDTSNFFVDVTGTAERIVKKTLNIITSSIIEYFPEASLETVEIQYRDKSEYTPDFSPESAEIAPEKINSLLGLKLSNREISELLLKMRHGVEDRGDKLSVLVPAYRNDIMHERDLIEDVAISFGYKNFVPTLPSSFSVGEEKEKSKIEKSSCNIMSGLGYLEVTTLILTNEEKCYQRLLREDEENRIMLENPISSEQTILRTSILPGLLEIFNHNSHHELPQKIFEVGDVVFYDKDEPRSMSKESLSLAIAIMDPKSTFSLLKADTESFLRERNKEYGFREASYPFFIKGRQADIIIKENGKEEVVGFLGEVHPEVISNFGLSQPITAAEITLIPNCHS